MTDSIDVARRRLADAARGGRHERFLRASVHYYNTDDEVDRLVAAVSRR